MKPNYQLRYRIEPNEGWSYSLSMENVHKEFLSNPEMAIHLPLPMSGLEIQYQDLEIPTLMRNQLGETAWQSISIKELQSLVEVE